MSHTRKRKDLIQVYNPRIDRWVKIDRKRGGIISVKRSPGPYKGVTRYRKKKR